MNQSRNTDRSPPKWVQWVYQKVLSAGRYAPNWITEFLIAYEDVLQESGQDGANEWLLQELEHTFGASVIARWSWVIRWAYTVWRVYRKMAKR